MAKLIIYRGDEFEQEVDLGEGVARIGRGADNEIVLADPMRSVSRQHAEIHFEQGSYSLIDSKSQNGLWVAGQRVKKATLAAGVPVVMGSYKLILKEEQPPVSATDATVFFRLPVDDATIVRANPFVAAPPPAAKAAPPAPAPPPPVKVDAPKPPPPPAPKPAPPAPVVETPKPPPPAPPPRPTPPSPPPPSPPPPSPAPSAAPPVAAKRKAGTSVPRALVWSVLIVLLLGGLGAGVFLTPLREWVRFPGTTPATTTAVATPAAPEPAPVAAPPPVRRAPTRRPVERPVKAEVKPTPPPPKRPTPAVVEAPPPPPPVKETPPDLAGLFEEARSAVIKGDYLTAIARLETILKYDANYASASNLLEVARGGAKNASQLAIDSGNKAEMSSDYATAAKQYDRARLLDPTSSGPGDAMRRLRLRMQGEGEEVFKKAKVFDAMGRRPDAIAGYEKALELLPAEHPSAKLARESLAALKGGG